MTTKRYIKDLLSNFLMEFATNPKDSNYELMLNILFQANTAQVMEVYEMGRAITKTEQEAVERVVLKFNLNRKCVEDGKKEENARLQEIC